IIEDKAQQVNNASRATALNILKELGTTQKDYAKSRDMLSSHTSHLSAYIKFGLVSIREVYHAAQKITKVEDRKAFQTQLYWNNFYITLQRNFNSIVHPLKPRPALKWTGPPEWWKKWRTATTGIPIIDAAMTELIETGYMHNRGRLIVANCLSHWLLVNWRHGERFFAEHLTDYDPYQNNGNWAYTSSFGADYQVRIYNPYNQGKRHDPQALYIKKWLPQLAALTATQLHNWYKYYKEFDLEELGYYPPIIWNPSKRYKEVRKIFMRAPAAQES
ncbi:hypothetical protein KDA11_06205, partial [Candidatus Saccharibacteria bacterium]|nr:hypothetical protein [Candidatus Saccharibacteria bacterium]